MPRAEAPNEERYRKVYLHKKFSSKLKITFLLTPYLNEFLGIFFSFTDIFIDEGKKKIIAKFYPFNIYLVSI